MAIEDLPAWMQVAHALVIAWHVLYFMAFIGTWFQANGPAEQIRRELWWVETRIAYPVVILIFAITAVNTYDRVMVGLNILFWILTCFHDHDDRWKKRRKKALSKVKLVAGRLIVVPLPNPA